MSAQTVACRCRVCGFDDERAGAVPLVEFPIDLDGTRRSLSARAFDASCPNRRTLKPTFSGFIFVAATTHLAILCAPDAGDDELEELRGQLLAEVAGREGGVVVTSGTPRRTRNRRRLDARWRPRLVTTVATEHERSS